LGGWVGTRHPIRRASRTTTFDAWNARFVEDKRNAKLPDILSELEASHHDFVAAANALSDESFAAGSPAREMFEGAGAPHYREHAGQIRDWREKGMH